MAAFILLLAQTHWAFRPPADAPPPPGPSHPIDAFIEARLKREGLDPAPAADPRALVRRVHFVLTGLPPTAEEVEAFAAAPSEAAWERLVERLLASPHYGERWGRHWLDMARYADTKGYVYDDREEARFVHSYAYRDWVVRALNEDLPYDRFLMLQLAADRLVEGPDRRDLAAMGFLTVGRRFINNVHDIIDDRIDTTARGMLALTIGCARCHDHKYDPIPQADYYALYGVFAGSAERIVPLEPGRERTPDLAAFDAELRKRQEAFDKKLAEKSKALFDRLRSQTTRYLEAVLQVESLNTEEFYAFVGPEDINPVIARHWHDFLYRAGRAFDPVFAPWHAMRTLPEGAFAGWLAEHAPRLHPRVAEALAGAASMRELPARYGKLLEAVHAAAAPDEADEPLRQVLYGPHSPFALPVGPFADFEWFFDESTRQELGKLNRDIERWIIEAPAEVAHGAILEDRPVQHHPRVFKRGNPALRGEEVPRRWLSLFGGRLFTEGSGRLELARAVASADNPLTARVAVNRVWLHHFGDGLVRTPSDFGVRSDPPTHPELLDWLARRFVRDGWSLKKLHRLILTSAAWRRSCEADAAARTRDPDNRLWARANRRRLDFEAMRDSILAVSGTLDPAIGGRPVDIVAETGPPRRSIYGFVDRLNLPGLFRSFDFTGADAHQPQRHDTTVPQQALFFLNSPFMIAQARALAEATAGGEPGERVARLVRRVYGRDPRAEELALALPFAATEREPERVAAPPSDWSYGYGEVDEAAGKLKSFTPLPHFTGDAWQGGPAWPDAALGWVKLDARGGHVGNDPAHAAVRRWTAPRDVRLTIRGTIRHARPEGDGIRARILHARRGELARWVLHEQEARVDVKPVAVRKGETLDFEVDAGAAGEITWDEFFWEIVLEAPDGSWNSAAEFRGTPPKPLGAWERLAQALLVSNEFIFID